MFLKFQKFPGSREFLLFLSLFLKCKNCISTLKVLYIDVYTLYIDVYPVYRCIDDTTCKLHVRKYISRLVRQSKTPAVCSQGLRRPLCSWVLVPVWGSTCVPVRMHGDTGTNIPPLSGSEVVFAYPRGLGTYSSV